MTEMYYVYCRERSTDGIACWWRPNRCGYTSNLDDAGLYTKADADDIEEHSAGEDFGVSQFVVGSLIQHRIVRTDWGANWQAFRKRAPLPPKHKEGTR